MEFSSRLNTFFQVGVVQEASHIDPSRLMATLILLDRRDMKKHTHTHNSSLGKPANTVDIVTASIDQKKRRRRFQGKCSPVHDLAFVASGFFLQNVMCSVESHADSRQSLSHFSLLIDFRAVIHLPFPTLRCIYVSMPGNRFLLCFILLSVLFSMKPWRATVFTVLANDNFMKGA